LSHKENQSLMPFRSVALRVLVMALLCPAIYAQAKRGGPSQNTEDFGRPPSRSWFGDLSEPYGNVSENTARSFLSSNADRFGLDPGLQGLTLADSGTTPMGVFFQFRQSYQGVAVYGAEVKVNFNRQGRAVAVNSSYVLALKLNSPFPNVGPEQARRKVEENIPASAGVDSDAQNDVIEPKLYIIIDQGAAVLAWEVARHSEGASWRALVHAGNGSLLSGPRDVNRYATGTGRVFQVNAVVAAGNNALKDSGDSASAVPLSAYMSVSLQRLTGKGHPMVASLRVAPQRAVFSIRQTFSSLTGVRTASVRRWLTTTLIMLKHIYKASGSRM
jgi:Zn-dependent metalloprotease